ncbi:H-X9-DG-CTERM domain-containing protein [Singulisphaera sp. Ch08]|uniref:H-X9-DG-CTERM domain-containing protein n=1 Tax=Singulisphaera sp. Ch08 TaxID=3120278 RepID=A0AAU7CTQ6_9BACT
MSSGAIYTDFYTVLGPNSLIPDCGHEALVGIGIFTARSYHRMGVNTVFMDGSVRWMGSNVNTRIWRGLGTRAGKEIVQ